MTRQPLLCLLAAVALAAPAAGALEVAARVSDPAGRPLGGAVAELSPLPSNHSWALGLLSGVPAPAATARAETGADGWFAVEAPGPGVWTLTVSAPGHVPMRFAPLPAAEARVLPEVVLWPAELQPVRVLDPAGAPAAGVWVHAASSGPAPWDGADGWRPGLRLDRTGAEGTALLSRAVGERLEVHVLPVGALVAVAARGDGVIELRLPPARPSRTLRVVDAAGRPAAGVVLSRSTLAWPAGSTAADGTLRLAGGGDPGVVLFAAAGERLRAELPSATGEGDPAVLRLPAPASVSGRVVASENRQPLAGALVWPLHDPGRFTRSGPAGEFLLPAASAPGSEVVVEAPGRLPRRVRLTAGESPALALELASALRGRVLDSTGQPVLRAAVSATAGDPARVVARGLTDSTGGFALSGLAARDAVVVAASREGYLPAAQRVTTPLEGSAAAPLRLVLVPGRAAFGRVLGPGDQPVAGAAVEVRASAAAPGTSAAAGGAERPPAVRAESDAEGRFDLVGLPAARVDLEVRAAGFAPRVVRGLAVPPPAEMPSAAGRSDATEPVDLGTVLLDPGAVLSGRITGAEGEPLPAAEVRLMPDEGGHPARLGERLAGQPPQATANRAGRFRIADLPAGRRVHLLISAPGHLPVELPAVQVPTSRLAVALEPASALAGTVEEATGRPVASAAVLLRAAEPPPGTTGGWLPRPPEEVVSDADGRFRFPAVAPGRAALEVSAPGYVSPEPLTVEIPAGGGTAGAAADVVVVLQRGARVEGTATDAAGEPVADARVRVGRVRGATDADGRFRLDGVETGRRMLVASHLEYETVSQEVEVEPEGSRFDLVLAGGWPVSGRVVDEEDRPVAGADVALEAESAGGALRRYRVVSGGDGGFRFARVVDGRYAVAVAAPGFAPPREKGRATVRGGAVDGLEVVLAPGASVEGRLLGLDFEALAAARVSATAEGVEQAGVVDHEGRYRLADLAAGVWSLRAWAPGGRQAEARLVVESGERRVEHDLRFEGVTLTGRVTHGGEPVPGASLSLVGRDNATAPDATTDWDGRFRLEDLVPGRYLLSVSSSREGLLENRELDLGSDQEIEVEIATLRLAGRVASAADGHPIGNALVRLQREVGAGGEPGSLLTVGTDRAGRFEVLRLSGGSYRLGIEADGHAPHEERLELRAGTTPPLEVVLEPVDALELVLGGAGAGANVARLAVLGPDGTVVSQGAYPVEAGGRVRLRRLPPGSWRLLVSTPGSAMGEVTVALPGPSVPVDLQPGYRLEVRVPALLEAGLSGQLTLATPHGSLLRGQEPSGALLDRWVLPGGAGVVDNLPAGAWVLRVTAPDGRSWQQPVVLPRPAGEPITLF